MSVTAAEIGAFVRFAHAEVEGDRAPATLEDCLLRWWASDEALPFTLPPFLGGKTLLDVLKEAGLVGLDDDGANDLASDPEHMSGFGKG